MRRSLYTDERYKPFVGKAPREKPVKRYRDDLTYWQKLSLSTGPTVYQTREEYLQYAPDAVIPLQLILQGLPMYRRATGVLRYMATCGKFKYTVGDYLAAAGEHGAPSTMANQFVTKTGRMHGYIVEAGWEVVVTTDRSGRSVIGVEPVEGRRVLDGDTLY